MKTGNAYTKWLKDVKNRIRQSQIKAAVKINSELLRLYWDMGQDIVDRQMEAAWGSGFFEQLSKDLRSEFPHMEGFSTTNLNYIKRFYQFYTKDSQIRPQLVDELQSTNKQLQVAKNKRHQIRHQAGDELSDHPIFQVPWRHHIEIITKSKSIKEALFYVQKTIENGWSRGEI